jgi:HPt (histidine-containing phosphotransfer) domain-containing protein
VSDDEFQQMLAAANAEFRASLPARIAAIDALWVQLVGGGATVAQMEELIRLVHKIAGSAGTFGEVEVGELAAEIEVKLTTCRGTAGIADADVRDGIAAVLGRLRAGVG